MTVLNLQVAASADDSEQYTATCAITNAYIRLYNASYMGSWRWVPGTAIPIGSTINSASLSIKFTGTANDTILGDVRGEESATPAQFTTDDNNISGRTLTTAAVAMDTTDGGADWVVFNVKSILDELTVSYTISAIVFVLTAEAGGDGRIITYDGSSTDCAKLDIDYTAPAGGVPKHAMYYARLRQ